LYWCRPLTLWYFFRFDISSQIRVLKRSIALNGNRIVEKLNVFFRVSLDHSGPQATVCEYFNHLGSGMDVVAFVLWVHWPRY
jgi:hypothetical protein